MKSLNFQDKVGRCHRQYIQFLNQQAFSQQIISLLFAFQSLSITCTLLQKISQQEPFFTLSLLGLHPLLELLSNSSIAIKIIIMVVLFVLLMVPVAVLLDLLLESYGKEYTKNEEYKKKCQSSIFHQVARNYFITFQFLMLPIIINFFSNDSSVPLIVSVCTLVLAQAFLIDYHMLEITYKESNRIIKMAFPYKLFDTTSYFIIIILANSQDVNLCLYGAFLGNIIRFFLSLFLQFYTSNLSKIHHFYLILNQVLLLGLLVGYNSQYSEFILFLALILGSATFWKKEDIVRAIFGQSKPSVISEPLRFDEEQMSLQESLKSQQISSIQYKLEKQSNFAGIFRKLIMLGKKKISHRQHLIIQILKSKCYNIEINSRGTAARIIDCETVMKYESLLSEIVCLVLEITNRSISLLKLMKLKQERSYIFNEEVQNLIQYLSKIKDLIRDLMNINQWSQEGQVILNMMFDSVMKDEEFCDQIKQLRRKNKKDTDKALKIHLFNQQTVMIFVNMLDEIGKITKTSKNLPNILGYNPNELQGIQIDDLLLKSMKNHHIKHMTNFIQSYDKRQALNPKNVLYYINNNHYELQKVDVKYNFVMSSFNMFHMCGIIKKMDCSDEVLILNQYGNIQGFTQKIGIQLDLDRIAGPEMNQYNVLCLIPSLLKYRQKDVKIKTVLFKVTNMSSTIWKAKQTQKKRQKMNEIQNSVFSLFQKILEDDIIEAYFVEVEVSNVVFFEGLVKLKTIVIKSYQKLMNFYKLKQTIQSKLRQSIFESTGKTLGTNTELNLYLNDSQMNNFDTNFSLDVTRRNWIKRKDLQIDIDQIQDIKSIKAISQLKSEEITMLSQTIQRQKMHLNHGMNKMRLTRNWKCVSFLTILILCINGLIINNYTYLKESVVKFQTLNRQVITNHKTLSIIIKSLYDPDHGQIKDFSDNKMVNDYENLINHKFNYSTTYNSSIIYNDYYLFNIHIPTLLKSFLSSNSSLVAQKQAELNLNVYNLIIEMDTIFKQMIQSWSQEINRQIQTQLVALMITIINSLVFFVIGICMIVFRKKQINSYEAFFKFQRNDLDQKVQKIKLKIKQLQNEVAKWHLSKKFQLYVKENDIFNLEFQNISTVYQPRIGFQISENRQEDIRNWQLTKYITYIIMYIVVQILICLFFTLENDAFLNHLKIIPQEIDKCSKIIVAPYFLLSSINRTIPDQLLDQYVNSTYTCLSQSVESIPSLIDFTATAPCSTCTILYPFLSANYRSYFSSFQSMVKVTKKGDHETYNFTQMTESAEIFTTNLQKQLYLWKKVNPNVLVPLSYIFIAIMIILVTWLNIRKIDKEVISVEIFLQLFSKEMIQNNMFMANLLEINE